MAPSLTNPPPAPPPGGWPRISIVTPSFNQGWALERTIRSVLDQGYPNLEYIIMDGGSTDDSLAVIQRYASRLTYWQHAPDEGQTAALVSGLTHATGRVLGYLNSDDILQPGSLAAVGRAVAAGATWVVGWTQVIDEWDRELMIHPTLPLSLADLIRHRYIIPQEATFVTRELYDRSGGLDASYNYAMDAHLWMRILSLEPPTWLPILIGGFRIHPHQKTMRMDLYWEEFERAAAGISAWRMAQGLPALPPAHNFLWFNVLKVVHYLRKVGPLNIWRIWQFRRKFRSDG